MEKLSELIKAAILKESEGPYNMPRCRYLREKIEFLGVGPGEIRKASDIVINNYGADRPVLVDTVMELMGEAIGEYKISAVKIIEHHLTSMMSDPEIAALVNDIYRKKLINDWYICDWLSTSVLTPLIDRRDEAAVSEIASWRDREYKWQARASLVPFALAESLPERLETVNEISSTLIKRDEGFVKSAVAWVMREAGKFDSPFVIEFFRNNGEFITPEVEKKAGKYLNRADRKEIKQILKKSHRRSILQNIFHHR